MANPISERNEEELLDLVRSRELTEAEALDALRNPFCTAAVAVVIADSKKLLAAQSIRELLSGLRDFPFARAMDLLATLPWTSLLALAQSPRTPPVIRRQAEKRLFHQIHTMTLGERVALARRVHRSLLRNLIVAGDAQVLIALLDNPRLAENDILVILNTSDAPPKFYAKLARHHKWGQYYGVRRGLAQCPNAPIPIALSALVQLTARDVENLCEQPGIRREIQTAAAALKEKEDQGLRRVLISSENDVESPNTDLSEGVR